MLLTLFSWCYIGITSFLWGFGIFRLLRGRNSEKQEGLDIYLLFGLCAITVYAQTFSLFAGVGMAANCFMILICLLILFWCHRQIKAYIQDLWQKLNKPYIWITVIILVILLVALTSGRVYHYDTDLYHAQAIRWIEEYGVVKGLGNLHNRLAYNSAFFSIQALYSLKFLFGQSIHTLNGFVAALMLIYALLTLGIFHNRKLAASDLLKIGFFIYLFQTENINYLSSPGSDTITLFMVLYLSSKWSEYAERKWEEPVDYGLLCILAVWTVTIKLSAGMLVLLTIYPAVLLICRKEWKKIGVFLLTGSLILAPFLIRNVMVSGYLVYPYASIDLFQVDWKMAASVAEDDSKEIMAWGRGMTSREDYGAPISVWLPAWYEKLSAGSRGMVWLNVCCLFFSVCYIFRALWKRNNRQRTVLLLSAMAGLILWFFTAPLMRYGYVYMLLLPALLGGEILERLPRKALAVLYITAGCLLLCMGYTVTERYFKENGRPPFKRQIDYSYREYYAMEWQGITLYVPQGSDCLGYHYFPGTNDGRRLEAIELRTGKLEEGFRIREEYREKQMHSGGIVVEE